jgi:hypothetical protein
VNKLKAIRMVSTGSASSFAYLQIWTTSFSPDRPFSADHGDVGLAGLSTGRLCEPSICSVRGLSKLPTMALRRWMGVETVGAMADRSGEL